MTKKYIDVPEGEYVYAEEHYVTLAGVQFKFPVKLDAKIKRVHLTKLSMTSGDDLWNLKFSFKGETLLP
jgi:hypothetical protein